MKLEELFCVRDKIVLITGGSRGIVEMIAEGFISNGAKVYITSRKENDIKCRNNANNWCNYKKKIKWFYTRPI